MKNLLFIGVGLGAVYVLFLRDQTPVHKLPTGKIPEISRIIGNVHQQTIGGGQTVPIVGPGQGNNPPPGVVTK